MSLNVLGAAAGFLALPTLLRFWFFLLPMLYMSILSTCSQEVVIRSKVLDLEEGLLW